MMAAETLVYEDEGTRLHGELYRPTVAANGRAVLVIHEADGIGGNVRRRAAMLAELGYIALVADLHGDGRVLADAEMRAAVDGFRADPERFRRRARAGLDALLEVSGARPKMAAAIGYCFGGTAVLELARSGAQLGAVASFHGLLTTIRPASTGEIRTSVAAFTGAKDPLVPPEDIAAFQAEMMQADACWQLTIYGQALHSFTNSGVDSLEDLRMRYDPDADRQSWAALLAFLDSTLGPPQ